MGSTERRIFVSPRAVDRIDSARAFLEGLPRDGQALVVASSREAADDLVRGLGRERGGLLGVHRLTPDRLAALLAADLLYENGRVPAFGLALEALTARVVHQLKGTGALGYFEPVIDRPGFPGALARTIAELRLARVSPEALAAGDGAAPSLGRALEAFAEELASAKLADRAAILLAAIDALSHNPRPRFAGVPIVMLDVAVESVGESDFFAALADAAPSILATAPHGDVTSIRLLERALRASAVTPSTDATNETSLHLLQHHLFASTAPSMRAADETLEIISAPGEIHECVEIARRIQTEARNGVPYDRIAVLCRRGARYAPHLEEALGRADIPAYFMSGTLRPEPGGRAMLALLTCAAEDLSAARFAEYLSLAQVPAPEDQIASEVVTSRASAILTAPLSDDLRLPPAVPENTPVADDPVPVVAGTARAPWRWERMLVDAAVIGGRDRWERRLLGLENEFARKRDEVGDEEGKARAIARQMLDLEHLRTVAMPIIDFLASAPKTAPWGEWLDYLRRLAQLAISDRAAIETALSELEPMGPVGPVGLDEVRIVLADRLGRLEAPQARRRYGAVTIAPIERARGMSFDVVIVPGLTERVFPEKLVEDPILSDAARRAVSPDLKLQENRTRAERLALHLAAGAAAKRAMFTYPRVDFDQGRPRVPSFYALEILRAAEGKLPGFDELAKRAACGQVSRLGWPAPADPRDAIDDTEFDLAVLDRLVDADPESTRGAAHYLLGANDHLGRALRARARRWLRRWTPADGLVDPAPEALAALSRHQLGTRPYSPTALQNFAACPYRFFMKSVMRIEPREEAQPIEVIDPLTRGGLTHEIQFELLMQFKERGGIPINRERLADAYAALDAIVERVAGEWRDDLAPAIDRVWRDGIDSIRADLREWLRRSADDPQPWRPERFELAFGLPDREQCDPASVPDPVAIEGGLTVRGSIDVVERNAEGALRITDYKTGKIRAAASVVIGGGKILQPIIYALAAQKVLGEKVVVGRLYYCTAVGGYEERVVTIDDVARTRLAEFAATLDAALRAGFMPAAPEPRGCEWCDYRRVCGPYEEQRAGVKPAARLQKLNDLRAAP